MDETDYKPKIVDMAGAEKASESDGHTPEIQKRTELRPGPSIELMARQIGEVAKNALDRYANDGDINDEDVKRLIMEQVDSAIQTLAG